MSETDLKESSIEDSSGALGVRLNESEISGGSGLTESSISGGSVFISIIGFGSVSGFKMITSSPTSNSAYFGAVASARSLLFSSGF